MTDSHLALNSNAEELTLIAEEIGAEVIRGPVRYPGAFVELNVCPLIG